MERKSEHTINPEILETPHPLKRKEKAIRHLGEAVTGAEIQPNLIFSQLEPDNEFDRQRILSATTIAKEVYKSLWYPTDKIEAGEHSLILEDISKNQEADCYGFTYVTSDVLDTVGIEHWIGYANGHAMIILPPQQSEDIKDCHVIDPLLPGLNQPISESCHIGKMQQVQNRMEAQGRGLMMLDLDEFAENVGASARQLHRTVFSRINGSYKSNQSTMGTNGEVKNKLLLSLFDSTTGRSAIESHLEFRSLIAGQQLDDASDMLLRNEAPVLDIDARQDHQELKILVEYLCENQNIGKATALVEKYFASFEGLHDTRIDEAKADAYRLIAFEVESPELADKARKIYHELQSDSKSFKDRIRNKLGLVEELIVSKA